MTREEFLIRLEAGLWSLAPYERDSALAYYREYFEEAGNDYAVIAQLGDPGRLAAQIVADAASQSFERAPGRGTETGQGYQRYEGWDPQSVGPSTGGSAADGDTTRPLYGSTTAGGAPPRKTKRRSVSAIRHIILGILSLPVGIPLLVAALGVVVAIVVTGFGLVVALVAALVAIVGRAILIGLIYALAAGAAFGPGLLVGCVLVAVGALLLFIPLTVRLISLVVRGVGWLCAWVYRKLKEVIAQ